MCPNFRVHLAKAFFFSSELRNDCSERSGVLNLLLLFSNLSPPVMNERANACLHVRCPAISSVALVGLQATTASYGES